MAESESSDSPVAHNALEAANRWPGARTEFVGADGAVLAKLRQRKTGFKVFDAGRRPVALVAARGQQIDLVPLGDTEGMVLVKDDAAKGKVNVGADDPGPSVVYTLFRAEPPRGEGTDDTEHRPELSADRKRPVVRVIAFDLDDGRRAWRVLDTAGKRLADLVPFGEAQADPQWLLKVGDDDLNIELRPTGEGALRGIEARNKDATKDSDRLLRVIKTKMPASVLGPLLMKSDDLTMKAALMQLFRCDGLDRCRDGASPSVPAKPAP